MYTKELDLLQISLTHEYAFCNAVMEIAERIADVVTMQKWLLNTFRNENCEILLCDAPEQLPCTRRGVLCKTHRIQPVFSTRRVPFCTLFRHLK